MMTKTLSDGEQEIWNEMQHDAVDKPGYDESTCWEPCGELGKSLEYAVVAPNDLISQTLISKLASLVEYCEMERRGLLLTGATSIRDRLLDDPEIAAWVHQHRNDKLYSMRIPRWTG